MKRILVIAWARFRRWVYLLFVGMWRGECAFDSRHGPHICMIAAARKAERPTGWLHWEVTKTFYNPLNFNVVRRAQK